MESRPLVGGLRHIPNPNRPTTDKGSMNNITYSVNIETKIVTVTAIVGDADVCGNFEFTREYPYNDIGSWLIEFTYDLRYAGKFLHAREYYHEAV